MDLLSWLESHSQAELLERLQVVTEARGTQPIKSARLSQLVTALKGGHRLAIPAERAPEICLATNGEVSLEELRPDLYTPVDPAQFYSAIQMRRRYSGDHAEPIPVTPVPRRRTPPRPRPDENAPPPEKASA